MKLTPPESFNYKAATLSLASALNACRNDWRQKIQLRGMAGKGKSYLCARQPCNTRAQGSGKNPGTQKRINNDKCRQRPKKKGSLVKWALRKEYTCYKFMGSWLPGANLLLQELIIRTKTLIWEDQRRRLWCSSNI